ncbi:MAG: GWxTD domain-containing protein [Bacteroidetes bacterium]|jgi:GWxTD domain-containing protein|nr:GWxTD domain-containing protein [Bacteroidota bacterium]
MKLYIILIACCLLYGPLTANAQPQSPYERGLEQLYRGHVEDALHIWESSYDESERVDSRTGIEYIRVVSKQDLEKYFETATEMYYAAILRGSGVNSRIALRQEIERLKPLIGDGMYRQWTRWWEEEHDDLHPDMRGYWIQVDPSPSRTVNERLVEHWQRIAEAQNRFTKNRSTIYGTDERALVFIRYGEPDRVATGILTLQEMNVRRWLERQVLPGSDSPREEREMNQMNPDRSSSADLSAAQAEALEFAVYDFHQYPEYEIWFYDDLAISNGTSIPFIFGTDIRDNQFKLQETVDDFIPPQAFNVDAFEKRDLVRFTRAGITPALMLQMLYYEQLSEIDPLFTNRLNNLRDRLLEQNRDVYSGLDLQFKSENSELIQKRTLQAPRQLSTIETKIPQIPVNVYQYRFLDDENTPYLVTFLESNPHEAFMIDFSRNRPADVTLEQLRSVDSVPGLLTNYSLEHSLQQYDKNWNIIRRDRDEPGFSLERNGGKPGAVSIFTSGHTGRAQKSVSAELINQDPQSLHTAADTPYPQHTRGLGSVHYREPAPLRTHPDSLQLADLVLGYQDSLASSNQMFPFVVANNQTVPFQETLVLHFEVYNLAVQPNGFSRFELTYRILPVDENGDILTDQAEFILTLNFTSEQPRLIEDLEIETADLNPGLYQLRVQITDVNTSQTKNRSTRFEVLE